MRPTPAAVAAEWQRRGLLVEQTLIWLEARDRETGAAVGVGFSDAAADATITVVDLFSGVSQARVFHGAGALLAISPIRYEAGLTVRPVTVSLSPIEPTVEAAFRGYDPRGGRAQIWRRTWQGETGVEAGITPVFKGYVDSAPITRPAPGGQAEIAVEIVSVARMLTIASGAKRSDAEQTRRAGDRFYRHMAAAAGTVVEWGVPK
jgi:hypothetical protein